MPFESHISLIQANPALTDAELVALATTPVKTGESPSASRANLKLALMGAGIWAKLKLMQKSDNASVSGLAMTAVDYMDSSDFEVVLWDHPLMQTLRGSGLFTDDEINATHKAAYETWAAPIPGATEADFAAARVWARFQALADDVNQWNTALTFGRAVISSLTGLTGEQVDVARQAMIADLATWRAKVEAGEDVTGMPLAAKEIWDAVKGGG